VAQLVMAGQYGQPNFLAENKKKRYKKIVKK
jgi:hypothetical protein